MYVCVRGYLPGGADVCLACVWCTGKVSGTLALEQAANLHDESSLLTCMASASSAREGGTAAFLMKRFGHPCQFGCIERVDLAAWHLHAWTHTLLFTMPQPCQAGFLHTCMHMNLASRVRTPISNLHVAC